MFIDCPVFFRFSIDCLMENMIGFFSQNFKQNLKKYAGKF